MDRTLRGELDRSLRDGLKHLAAEALGRASRPVVDQPRLRDQPRREAGDAPPRLEPAHCSVMPLGFKPTLFRPNAVARQRLRAELGLDRTTIGYFGRVSPEKGVHHLVQALGLLPDEPWQLLLDEPRPSSSYAADILRQLESLGLQSRTIVFRADHDEIADAMNAADIVVAPSASRSGSAGVPWSGQRHSRCP